MFDKLTAVEAQYDALMQRLGSPEVQGDSSEYRKQAKALAEIEPLVERFREYKNVVRDLTGAEELAASVDADMRELAKQELKSLTAKRDGLVGEFVEEEGRYDCDERRDRDEAERGQRYAGQATNGVDPADLRDCERKGERHHGDQDLGDFRRAELHPSRACRRLPVHVAANSTSV